MSLDIYGILFIAKVGGYQCEVQILDKYNTFVGEHQVDRYLVEITNHPERKDDIGNVESISALDLISKVN